jgi:hypothetical protein
VRLSLVKIPSETRKAQRSDTLQTLEYVTAISFFQAVYFSVIARAHEMTVRTPIVVQSLRDVFTCWVLVQLVQFYKVLARVSPEPSSVWTLSDSLTQLVRKLGAEHGTWWFECASSDHCSFVMLHR